MKPEKLERWPVTVAFVKDFDGYLIEFVAEEQGQECQIQRKLDLTQGRLLDENYRRHSKAGKL